MKRRWIVVEQRDELIVVVARVRSIADALLVVKLCPYEAWVVDEEGWAALRTTKVVTGDGVTGAERVLVPPSVDG